MTWHFCSNVFFLPFSSSLLFGFRYSTNHVLRIMNCYIYRQGPIFLFFFKPYIISLQFYLYFTSIFRIKHVCLFIFSSRLFSYPLFMGQLEGQRSAFLHLHLIDTSHKLCNKKRYPFTLTKRTINRETCNLT